MRAKGGLHMVTTNSLRKVWVIWRLLAVSVILLIACQPPVVTPTPTTVPPLTDTPLPEPVQIPIVRGYLAAAVGNLPEADAGGIFAKEIEGKEIFLPGVEVYLEDPQTSTTSDINITDLSGRFTLLAPASGRYRICWKSAVYDNGCTSVFVSAGSSPEFVSTVYIRIPRRSDYVAVVGHVTTGDGTLPRTFEPLLNINSFATIGLDDEKGNRIADVYVNNFGDYLLPYVPVKQKIKLTASIESATFTQEIWPEAQIEVAPLHQVNLKFKNNRPRLDPLVALDSVNNRHVQNATPGSAVNIKANARDKDGDPVEFAWFVDPSQGQLSSNLGSTVQWQLPSTPGRYAITVVAFDNNGGYDKAELSVLADGKGIPFTGIVVETNGTPVAAAEIEIVGNPVITTDITGHFQTIVNEADRYVFNVRKQGYALNSQIYDRSITGGRWILRPAQLVTIDPTSDVTIVHDRSEKDCPGPESPRADRGAAGDSLLTPQWQDGEGNIIDTPQDDSQRVVTPFNLQLPKCGAGMMVEIPANSILDPSGNPATAPINVTISTVDLLSAQQMPGDDSVVSLTSSVASLQSYGAGALDFPSGFSLRPGASAKISIPVDRTQLMGGSLPPTVPLLSYNEQTGLWTEEGSMTLSVANGVQAYVADVTHFTTYNADTLFTDNACLRVFSPSLPGNYDLEFMSPYPNGTPHYKKYPIDNVSSTEHVIYNITPNVNVTLAPMTQGSNPQLLGFYVVNSGPITSFVGSPGAGNAPPGPPYVDCKNFVLLTTGDAPDSPFGGEFLHGLGFINAANLGFDDLTSAGPTGNTLIDSIVTASKNYYLSVDPTNARGTFADFKSLNGFSANPNTPAAGEIVAQYANSGDLGFGRDMHCLKKTNGDVACYVTNYGTGYSNIAPGGGTNDHDDANAAGQRTTVGVSAEVATVAMEYSPIENDPAGDKVVKFFVYKKNFPNTGDYGRSISANLDGRGERPVPQLCMICHGGLVPSQAGGVPAFGTAAQVKLTSRFLPFDHRFFTFPNNPATLSKASQEASIKNLNEQIVNAAPPAPASDPIHEVVSGLYNNGASSTQIVNFTVPGWVNGASAAEPNQANFYQGVLADVCRTCHIAQAFGQLQFNNSDKFINVSNAVTTNNRLMLGTAQLRVCGDYVMPHALRTHDIFWKPGVWDVSEWGPPPIPFNTQFQNFGDGVGGSTWKTGLCTSFISNLVSTPSQFYQHTLQPIWNGKCVACHITSGAAGFLPLTEGASYGSLVPGRVVAGNDDPNATGNTLLKRLSFTDPRDPNFDPTNGQRMPQNCVVPPTPPGPGQLPCLEQSDIDKIKAWIRSGAH
jgi:hypothetical protein